MHPLALSVLPSGICDRLRCAPEWKLTAEESSRKVDPELWVIWAGTGRLLVEETEYELRPGRCVLFRPGKPASATHSETDPLGLTFISFRFQQDDVDLEQYPQIFEVWNVHYLDAVSHRIVEIMRDAAEGEEQRRIAGILLSALLIDLVMHFGLSEQKQVVSVAQHHREKVRQTIQSIYDSVGSPLSVAGLARQAGYSVSHFSALFRKLTGSTPESTIVQARIDNAKRLLRWSSLAIGQVAQASGYPDIYFFSRQFKLKTGLTPSQYRAVDHDDRLELLHIHVDPVVGRETPGADEVKYGFEGGHVFQLENVFHFFVTELLGEPRNVRTRLAYWKSNEGLNWRRQSTLLESSGVYDGSDPRAALWSPVPIFDEPSQRWNLFYIAYRAAEDTAKGWFTNYEGQAWRAESSVSGPEGIGGPYVDKEIVLGPGPGAQAWEGLQGVSSFYPYRAGNQWYAFYGSARTEQIPVEYWGVGLAAAKKLKGAWKRVESGNPVLLDQVFVENPVVTRFPTGGGYLALFDGGHRGRLGYSFSADGIHWPGGQYLLDGHTLPGWMKVIRKPLGATFMEDGRVYIFFTAYDESHYANIGLLQVRIPSAV